MSIARLRQLQAELSAIAEDLQGQITAAEKARDPFVLFLYESRRSFSEAGLSSAPNSVHLVNRQVDRTYAMAKRHGFGGSREEWMQLLILKVSP